MKTDSKNDDHRIKFGASAGVDYDLRIKKFLAIQSGLSFAREGFRVPQLLMDERGGEIGQLNLKSHFDYLVVPLKARFYAEDFFVAVGGYAGYLLQQTISYDSQFQIPDLHTESYIDALNRTDYGYLLELGMRVPLRSAWSIEVMYSHKQGLADITKTNDSTWKSRSSNILAGVKRSF